MLPVPLDNRDMRKDLLMEIGGGELFRSIPTSNAKGTSKKRACVSDCRGGSLIRSRYMTQNGIFWVCKMA